MKITRKKLVKLEACHEAVEWFSEKYPKGVELIAGLKDMIKDDSKFEWANWFIVRVMTRKQYLRYAVYAASQALHIYEEKHPNDDRPRKAIQAARRCVKNDTKENKAAAGAAWAAAWAAMAGAGDASGAAWAADGENW